MLTEWIAQIDPLVVARTTAVIRYTTCAAANHAKWAGLFAAFHQSEVFRFAGKTQILAHLNERRNNKNNRNISSFEVELNFVCFVWFSELESDFFRTE